MLPVMRSHIQHRGGAGGVVVRPGEDDALPHLAQMVVMAANQHKAVRHRRAAHHPAHVLRRMVGQHIAVGQGYPGALLHLARMNVRHHIVALLLGNVERPHGNVLHRSQKAPERQLPVVHIKMMEQRVEILGHLRVLAFCHIHKQKAIGELGTVLLAECQQLVGAENILGLDGQHEERLISGTGERSKGEIIPRAQLLAIQGGLHRPFHRIDVEAIVVVIVLHKGLHTDVTQLGTQVLGGDAVAIVGIATTVELGRGEVTDVLPHLVAVLAAYGAQQQQYHK